MGLPYATFREVRRQAAHLVVITSLVVPAIAQQMIELQNEDAGWIALYDNFLMIQARLIKSQIPPNVEEASLEVRYSVCVNANEADHLLQLFREDIAVLPPPTTEAGIRARTFHTPDRIAVVQSQIEELRAKTCDIDETTFRQLAELRAQDAGWTALLPRIYSVENPLWMADTYFSDGEPSVEHKAEACADIVEASQQLQQLQTDFAALPPPKTQDGTGIQTLLPRYFVGWQNEIDELRAKACARTAG